MVFLSWYKSTEELDIIAQKWFLWKLIGKQNQTKWSYLNSSFASDSKTDDKK